jgi:hypothetical protein
VLSSPDDRPAPDFNARRLDREEKADKDSLAEEKKGVPVVAKSFCVKAETPDA